jgi:cytochrome c oxidase subunit 4
MAKNTNSHATKAAQANEVEVLDTHHHVPLATYHTIGILLMVLLIITLAAAAVNLGPWNIVIAMVIAVIKATLVVLFFMHVKFSSRLVKLFAGAAFFWLAVLFILMLSDYMSRGWLPTPGK